MNVAGCFIPLSFHLSPTNTISIYHFNCIYVDLIKLIVTFLFTFVFNIYIYIDARSKYNWNAFNNEIKKMLVLYKICFIYTYIYIYIAAHNKYNWSAFNNVTKRC